MHRPIENLQNFQIFEEFSLALVHSKDVDPVYPFLKNIITLEKFDPEMAIFWYGYFYSIESMVLLLRGEKQFLECKFGTERGRTPQIRRIENMQKTYHAWLKAAPSSVAQKAKTGREFAEFIKTMPYFGGWVSYKYTELFEKVLGFTNLAPTDMNIAAGDPNEDGGPCGGFRALYGKNSKYSASVFPEWEALGVTLSKRWDFDLGEVETCACKYSKLLNGKYYIGHDVAEFTHLTHLWDKQTFEKLMSDSGFDKSLWSSGFVKSSKRAYKDHGNLLNNNFARIKANG